MRGSFPDLTPLLAPRSMAVVGAVSGLGRAGGRPIPFSRQCGFQGSLYPVNPRREEVDGQRCYARVSDLPETPDLATILVPAARTIEVVRDCLDAGVPALAVITSGFGEAGPEGAALEEALADLVRQRGAILCGPNCLGIVNLRHGLYASFSSALVARKPQPGPVMFVSQSGMLGGVAMAELHERGTGVGTMISVGNQAGIEIADVIAFAAGDPGTRVIAGYIEGTRDGTRLRAALALAREADKPVVLMKVGRNEEAARVAASHTGALAGNDRVWQSVLRKEGAIEARTSNELFDYVEALAHGVPAERNRAPGIAVLGNSGGFGVMAVDRFPEVGLKLAALTPKTTAALAAGLPSYVQPTNPVDFALQAIEEEETLGDHLEALMADPNVDGVLGVFGFYRPGSDAFADAIARVQERFSKRVVFACPHSSPDFRRQLRSRGVPEYDTVERAVDAFATLFRRPSPTPTPEILPSPTKRALAERLARVRGRKAPSEGDAMEILAALGISVTREGLATSPGEAVRLARRVGAPVALKAEGPDLLHKTELGAIALDVTGPEAVERAYRDVIRGASGRTPAGVGVHRMVNGVELLVGVRRDPVFGPVVGVGAGGISAEIMDDVQWDPGPLGLSEAEAMIRSLRCFPLLDGFRGRPKASLRAVADVVVRLAACAQAFPAIRELEINPLFAGPKEAIAADALVVLDDPAT